MTEQLVYAVCFKDGDGSWVPMVASISPWEEMPRKFAQFYEYTAPRYTVRRFRLVEVLDG